MSKMKLLLDVVSDLRSLADSLQAVADAVAQGGQEQPDQTTEERPAQEPEKKTAAKKEEPSTEKAGLLIKHGADKLSDIDPAEYPALLAEAEVL